MWLVYMLSSNGVYVCVGHLINIYQRKKCVHVYVRVVHVWVCGLCYEEYKVK